MENKSRIDFEPKTPEFAAYKARRMEDRQGIMDAGKKERELQQAVIEMIG